MKHTKDTPNCVPGKALSEHHWREGPALDGRQGKVYQGGIICWGDGVVPLESDLCLS